MNTAVVHNIRLYDFVAVRHNDVGQGITQKVIAYVTQVKRFVGIG